MKFGQNQMQFFDKRFEPYSYFWWTRDAIVLSLISVQPKFRGKGVLKKLLKTVKRYGKKVVIPCPSKVVAVAAYVQGYRQSNILAKLPSGRSEEIGVIVWTPQCKK